MFACRNSTGNTWLPIFWIKLCVLGKSRKHVGGLVETTEFILLLSCFKHSVEKSKPWGLDIALTFLQKLKPWGLDLVPPCQTSSWRFSKVQTLSFSLSSSAKYEGAQRWGGNAWILQVGWTDRSPQNDIVNSIWVFAILGPRNGWAPTDDQKMLKLMLFLLAS